ncbi:hypothetical protein TEQG_08009 [Trichophyton equinum CBS 127.97]|uniref:Uncharacterized protein n=1 Tax=Trichophyton equinum (strain ATCC MYA-4606 / CBS 127.97) TaxID=559882 RepID=F2Q4X6_TRIEC|nr:hypothetical protein TEQG_08009 [Trichophyton equinum CBS 127.97]
MVDRQTPSPLPSQPGRARDIGLARSFIKHQLGFPGPLSASPPVSREESYNSYVTKKDVLVCCWEWDTGQRRSKGIGGFQLLLRNMKTKGPKIIKKTPFSKEQSFALKRELKLWHDAGWTECGTLSQTKPMEGSPTSEESCVRLISLADSQLCRSDLLYLHDTQGRLSPGGGISEKGRCGAHLGD